MVLLDEKIMYLQNYNYFLYKILDLLLLIRYI